MATLNLHNHLNFGEKKVGGSTAKYHNPAERKPAVPKKDEKPILGLVSKKNFIVANAVENILSQAKTQAKPVEWTKKEDYGKVPRYMENIKDNINNEYEHIRNLQELEQEQRDREKYISATKLCFIKFFSASFLFL